MISTGSVGCPRVMSHQAELEGEKRPEQPQEDASIKYEDQLMSQFGFVKSVTGDYTAGMIRSFQVKESKSPLEEKGRVPFAAHFEIRKERAILDRELSKDQVNARLAARFQHIRRLERALATLNPEGEEMLCRTTDGQDLFQVAMKVGGLEAVRVLREAGYPFQFATNGSLTPRYYAYLNGNDEVSRYLISKQTPIEIETEKKLKAALSVSTRFGNITRIQISDMNHQKMALHEIVISLRSYIHSDRFQLNASCKEKFQVVLDMCEECFIEAHNGFKQSTVAESDTRLLMRFLDQEPVMLFQGFCFVADFDQDSSRKGMVNIRYLAGKKEGDGLVDVYEWPQFLPEVSIEMPILPDSKFNQILYRIPFAIYLTLIRRLEGTIEEKIGTARDLVLDWLQWDFENSTKACLKTFPHLSREQVVKMQERVLRSLPESIEYGSSAATGSRGLAASRGQ